MATLFSGPPKPPPLPVMKPVQNTALTASIQAANRRMGAAGTMFGPQTQNTNARAGTTSGANTLTGN
jgi:hypothetical protein